MIFSSLSSPAEFIQVESSLPALPIQASHFSTVTNPLEAFLKVTVNSHHTRKAYKRHIEHAFRMLQLEFLGDLQPGHLVQYRSELLDDGRGLASHAQALSALRSFLLWCSDMGGLPFPARMVERLLKVPSAEVLTPYVTLTRDEVKRMLDAATSIRDKALIQLMLGAGLRVSEVANLDCKDLIEIDGQPAVWVRQGKGNKDRYVPIRPELLAAIHRYRESESRPADPDSPLFHAHDRACKKREISRLSHHGIRNMLATVAKAAGIEKRVTPHAMRHTFGMEFQRASKDLNKTARIMGHKTIRPTLRYTNHLQMEELRENLPNWE